MLLSAVWLASCGPSQEDRARALEERRVECLEKRCEGDVLPNHDQTTDAVMKIGGQWFIGPSKYFSDFNRAAYFEWWQHRPLERGVPRPVDAQAVAVSGRGQEIVISIHLSREQLGDAGSNMSRAFKAAQTQGRVISQSEPRPGLEVWKVRSTRDSTPETWFVATAHVSEDPDGALLSCWNVDDQKTACTTGFKVTPGVVADVRLSPLNAADWPEIRLEVTRVLRLLKRG